MLHGTGTILPCIREITLVKCINFGIKLGICNGLVDFKFVIPSGKVNIMDDSTFHFLEKSQPLYFYGTRRTIGCDLEELEFKIYELQLLLLNLFFFFGKGLFKKASDK